MAIPNAPYLVRVRRRTGHGPEGAVSKKIVGLRATVRHVNTSGPSSNNHLFLAYLLLMVLDELTKDQSQNGFRHEETK